MPNNSACEVIPLLGGGLGSGERSFQDCISWQLHTVDDNIYRHEFHDAMLVLTNVGCVKTSATVAIGRLAKPGESASKAFSKFSARHLTSASRMPLCCPSDSMSATTNALQTLLAQACLITQPMLRSDSDAMVAQAASSCQKAFVLKYYPSQK